VRGENYAPLAALACMYTEYGKHARTGDTSTSELKVLRPRVPLRVGVRLALVRTRLAN
jgi:hypothetical protein